MSPLQAVEAAGIGTQVARPLKVLVPLIKDDLAKGKEAAEQAGMPYYRAAGEKMLEAKASGEINGRFEDWIDRTFGIKRSQAQEYIRLARTTFNAQNAGAPEFSSIREFERYSGRNRPTSGRVHREWREDVDKLVERARLAEARLKEEHLTREQEREAKRKLAERLIDIGYKVLAKELHPDKGGSKDAIQRLHEVRDELKSHRFI